MNPSAVRHSRLNLNASCCVGVEKLFVYTTTRERYNKYNTFCALYNYCDFVNPNNHSVVVTDVESSFIRVSEDISS